MVVVGIYLADRYVWVTPEEEVRRFVERGRRAAESMSVLRCERFLDRDFSTAAGMDRASFLYFARSHFARLRSLQVDVQEQQLTISEDKTEAELVLGVMLVGTDQHGKRWLGIRGNRSSYEEVLLRLVKHEGHWKAVWAEW